MTAAGIAALVTALMGTLVAFGVPLTDQQRSAVRDLVMVGFPIVAFGVAAFVARSKVTPQTKIDQVPVAARALEQAQQHEDDKRVQPYIDALKK